MPRKKKQVPINEQIAKVSADIETLSTQLKNKRARLKMLVEMQEQENSKMIITALKDSGKDLSEVLDYIRS